MRNIFEQKRAERLSRQWASVREWAEYVQATKEWNQDEIARIIDGEESYAVRVSGLNYCGEAMEILERTGEKKKVVDVEFKNKWTYLLYIWIKK